MASKIDRIWDAAYEDGRNARAYFNPYAAGSKEFAACERGFLAGQLARSIRAA